MENAFLETWEINFEFMNFTEQASIITPIVSRDDPPPPPPGLKESLNPISYGGGHMAPPRVHRPEAQNWLGPEGQAFATFIII